MKMLSRAAFALLGTPLCCVPAATAHAEQDAVNAYVSEHGTEVCGFMRAQPGLPGVKHAVDHILATSGLPEDQTGPLLGASVTADCPDSADSVREFVWYVQHHQQGAGSGAVLGS